MKVTPNTLLITPMSLVLNLAEVQIRALALKNANAISMGNLTFAALKSSASKNCKGKYCKFFCNTATVQF